MTTALTDRAAARYRREHTARAQHGSNGALTGVIVKKSMLAVATLIAAASATAAVGSAAPDAHAGSQDDQFLGSVHSRGINGDPGALISFAHTMCDVVGTPGGIGPMYSLSMSQGLPMPQVASVVVEGLRAYCPEKSSLMGPLAR